VSVNDGTAESKKFGLKVEVLKAVNQAPEITGQIPLSIQQGESITIAFNRSEERRVGKDYPDGFTLNLYGGPNYSFNGTTVTPSPNLSGMLTVQVSVNDGTAESKRFGLKVEVLKAVNQPPEITGQIPLSIQQGESITIAFNHLQVTDPDNKYPDEFTLKLFGGPNYSFNGTTVTPSP